MEMIYILVGLYMAYSIVHFILIQHSRVWDARSSYEKFVTVFAIVSIGLVFLGSME